MKLLGMLKKVFNSKAADYFVQLLIVMIGVFLGMLVTEWRADSKTEKDRKTILKSIRVEISSNKQLIEASFDKLGSFTKSLDSLNRVLTKERLAENFYDRPFQERLPNWKGVGGEVYSSSMFETAKYSNVLPGMNVDLLEQLSSTYSMQHLTNELKSELLNKFLAINSTTPYSDVLRLMNRIKQELGGVQYLLDQEYDKCLQLIDEHKGIAKDLAGS